MNKFNIKKNLIFLVLLCLLFTFLFSSCSDDSSYNSGRYGEGSAYDDDVDSIADAYGMDPDVVNDQIHAVEEAMNR